MDNFTQQQAFEHFAAWGSGQELVRAMLLTSSRAVPGAQVDVFSDYDVILALTDIRPFFESRAWLEDFGPVLAIYRDPIVLHHGLETSGYVVQYDSSFKIDFTLWPVERLREIVAEPQLPDEFDAGYLVLLDKDGLTAGLQAPTYKAFIPTPPTEADYQEMVEGFFLETAYVAKYLWRDDMMAAKFILDHIMKQERLLPVLEWHAEIDHGWSVKPGPHGRRLKQWLRPDLWAELESTYTGAAPEANWEALFRSIALFRRAAVEVGDLLGYTYPEALEQRAVAYVNKVKRLRRDAETFS